MQHFCMDDNHAVLRRFDLRAVDQGCVAVVPVHEFQLRHNIIQLTSLGLAIAASKEVLEPMCRKNRAAAEAYYHRLLDKIRSMDNNLELDTSTDLTSQPAWTKYCKECINLLELRKILYGEIYELLQLAGRQFKRGIEQITRKYSKVFDLHQTYELQITDVVGSFRVIQRTGKQLLDGLSLGCRSMNDSLNNGQVVMEYYRLMSTCREMDKVVEDSWEHRPTKFKQRTEFCDTCHIALLYYSAFHGTTLKVRPMTSDVGDHSTGSQPSQAGHDDEQNLTLRAARLPQRPVAASYNLPAIDNLKLRDEGSSSSSSHHPSKDVTSCGNASHDSHYLCIVRDKLVFVLDQRTLDLAGKDIRQWQPKPPNILVCQLKPEHDARFDMSHVLPDKELYLGTSVAALIELHDVSIHKVTLFSRDQIVDECEGYREELSAMDLNQLLDRMEVGIAGAKETMEALHAKGTLMLWLRQYLYGEPMRVLYTKATVPADVAEHLEKKYIRLVEE